VLDSFNILPPAALRFKKLTTPVGRLDREKGYAGLLLKKLLKISNGIMIITTGKARSTNLRGSLAFSVIRRTPWHRRGMDSKVNSYVNLVCLASNRNEHIKRII
jgi:hypothetical protein